MDNLWKAPEAEPAKAWVALAETLIEVAILHWDTYCGHPQRHASDQVDEEWKGKKHGHDVTSGREWDNFERECQCQLRAMTVTRWRRNKYQSGKTQDHTDRKPGF